MMKFYLQFCINGKLICSRTLILYVKRDKEVKGENNKV